MCIKKYFFIIVLLINFLYSNELMCCGFFEWFFNIFDRTNKICEKLSETDYKAKFFLRKGAIASCTNVLNDYLNLDDGEKELDPIDELLDQFPNGGLESEVENLASAGGEYFLKEKAVYLQSLYNYYRSKSILEREKNHFEVTDRILKAKKIFESKVLEIELLKRVSDE